MDTTFDESLFRKVIAVLVIAIVVVGAVAVLRFSGVLGGEEELPSVSNQTSPGAEEPPGGEDVTGLKTYAWTYREIPMMVSVYVTNDTYQQFASSPYDTAEETSQHMTDYVVTDGDGGIVDNVADQILSLSRASGFGDADTVGNVLAFVANLTYTTGGSLPPYPVVTLATGKGDSEDHAVLAAAVLKKMGYGVSLLYYPPTYDRRTIIPGATALGIVTDGTIPGRLYHTVAEAQAGRCVYYPTNGTWSATLPEGGDQASGWYSGEAVKQNATSSAPLGIVRYYPANQTFVAGTDVSDVSEIVVDDAVWQQPIIVSAAWTVNTTEKGVNRSAYDGMVPYFVGGDGLWPGRTLARDDRLDANTTVAGLQPLEEKPSVSANGSLTETLRIPVSEASPLSPLTWLEPVEDYYADVWYHSKIAWTYDDAWYLHDNFLAMDNPVPEDQDAYTLQGIANVSAPVSWRITYTIQEMDESCSDRDMTPYSDVRFAVYRIADGNAVLDRTFGWQTLYGAKKQNSASVFGPGDYAVAVFVRNCKVNVAIEYHGKPVDTPYHGDI